MSPLPQISVQPVKKRTRNFQEVSLGFSRKMAVEEARRCPQCSHPTCRSACPLGIDIPAFVRYIREGQFEKALDKIHEANPFPDICGRVCPAPCELKCILTQEGAPIGIRGLERFASDHGRKMFVRPRPAGIPGPKVAVVGSGPSGLTAAGCLTAKNFQVVLYESLPAAGGILQYAIPHFRLPKDIVARVLHDLARSGVALKCHTPIGQLESLTGLFKKGFQAVLLAPGAGNVVPPSLPGASLSRVYLAEELLLQGNFLKEDIFRKEMLKKIGRKVAVLGKTDKAWDVARLCLRLGREAAIVFPVSENELTTDPRTKAHGLEEGVVLKDLTRPVEILANEENRLIGVKCRPMDYGDPEGKGKWRLMPVPDADFLLEADTVVLADSEARRDVFIKIFPGVKLDRGGFIRTDEETGQTDLHGVFVAGAAAEEHLTLVEAMACGKKAAGRIEKYLIQTQ